MNRSQSSPSNTRGVPWSTILNDVTTQDSDWAQGWFELQAWEFMSAGNDDNPTVTGDISKQTTAVGLPRGLQGARETSERRLEPEKSLFVRDREFKNDVANISISDNAPPPLPGEASTAASAAAAPVPPKKPHHRRLKPLPGTGEYQRGVTNEDVVKLSFTKPPPSDEKALQLASGEIQKIPVNWEGDTWKQAGHWSLPPMVDGYRGLNWYNLHCHCPAVDATNTAPRPRKRRRGRSGSLYQLSDDGKSMHTSQGE